MQMLVTMNIEENLNIYCKSSLSLPAVGLSPVTMCYPVTSAQPRQRDFTLHHILEINAVSSSFTSGERTRGCRQHTRVKTVTWSRRVDKHLPFCSPTLRR